MKLGWGYRHQTEKRGIRPTVAVWGVGCGLGLGTECWAGGGRSGGGVQRDGFQAHSFATSEHLSMERTMQAFHTIALMFMGSVR